MQGHSHINVSSAGKMFGVGMGTASGLKSLNTGWQVCNSRDLGGRMISYVIFPGMGQLCTLYEERLVFFYCECIGPFRIPNRDHFPQQFRRYLELWWNVG